MSFLVGGGSTTPHRDQLSAAPHPPSGGTSRQDSDPSATARSFRYLTGMLASLTSGLRRRRRRRLTVERLVEDGRERRTRALADRDFVASLVLGLAFVAAAVAMALALPMQRHGSPLLWGAMVVVYAVVSRVEFEVGSGAGVPTQLVLVPMLFLLPPSYVPLVVAAGLVLGSLSECVRGSFHPARVLVMFVCSWHAVGPSLVFVAMGGPQASWRALPVLVVAMATQVLADGASATLREYLAFRVHPREFAHY